MTREIRSIRSPDILPGKSYSQKERWLKIGAASLLVTNVMKENIFIVLHTDKKIIIQEAV